MQNPPTGYAACKISHIMIFNRVVGRRAKQKRQERLNVKNSYNTSGKITKKII